MYRTFCTPILRSSPLPVFGITRFSRVKSSSFYVIFPNKKRKNWSQKNDLLPLEEKTLSVVSVTPRYLFKHFALESPRTTEFERYKMDDPEIQKRR